MYKNPKASRFEMARMFLFMQTFIASVVLGRDRYQAPYNSRRGMRSRPGPPGAPNTRDPLKRLRGGTFTPLARILGRPIRPMGRREAMKLFATDARGRWRVAA